ncbi:MAG: hydrolase [Variovorax sp.]|nr:MAG: hydrolase [Variovorax sp.]
MRQSPFDREIARRRDAGNATNVRPNGATEREGRHVADTRLPFMQTCDCHTHVFADPREFPLAPERKYTPSTADHRRLAQHLHALGLGRVVVVQPSVYGVDNSATLDAIAALGSAVARGVATIDIAHISDAELDRLAAGGMRGVRLNLETDGTASAAEVRRLLQAAARRVRGRGWHLQVHARLALIAELSPAFAALEVPLVLDHYAGTHASTPPDHPDFRQLLAAMRSGTVYVKLSAGHLCGVTDDDFARLAPLARALIAARADRLVWGSDWPHPVPAPLEGASTERVTPLRQVDDAGSLALLRACAPDQRTLEKILVSNPASLYGFEPA